VDGFSTRLIWNGLSPLEQLTRVGPIPGVNLQHFTRLQVPTPQVDGASVSFRLPTVPVSGTETIYLNGIAQDPSGDYSISGAVFTMVEAPASTAALLASWYTDGGIAFVRMQTPTPAVNGTTTSFALTETPISGTLTVYLNGVCLHPGIGNDYTSSGSSITLAAPPASTDKLRVSYVQSALPSGVSSVVTQAPTPAVDGTTTTFEFTGQQGAETVTLNGVILQPYADYTVDGTTLTMASPPAASDLLLVSSYAGLTVQPSEIFVDAVNGRILGTVNPLSDVSEYGLDALGSVTSSRNASGAVVNNYRYKPYGQMLAGFTPGQTGYFLFGGGLNYEFLNRQGAEISASMRIFSYLTANWTTRDPLSYSTDMARFISRVGMEQFIQGENPYVYVEGNPTTYTDPSGLQSTDGSGCGSYLPFVKNVIETWCFGLKSRSTRQCLKECIISSTPGGGKNVDKAITCMSNWCSHGGVRCKPCGAYTDYQGGYPWMMTPYQGGQTAQVIFCNESLANMAANPTLVFSLLAHELGHACFPFDTSDNNRDNLSPGGKIVLAVGNCFAQKCAQNVLNDMVDNVAISICQGFRPF
jgi:hypothetical protein